MGDTHKPNDRWIYNSPTHGELYLTFIAVNPKKKINT